MTERTMDATPSSPDGGWVNGSATLEQGMGHTHAGTTEAKVYTVGADSGQPAFLGCFAWQEGDDIEKRWDEFSAEMWRWGLQPPEDEPAFSITEDGITYDHYYLVSIYDEDE